MIGTISYSQNIILSRQVIGNAGGSHSTNNIHIMDNVGEVMVTTESTSDLNCIAFKSQYSDNWCYNSVK